MKEHLTGPRRGKSTQFPFADLLRQFIRTCLAGYQDPARAKRLSQDATFRLMGSQEI